MTAISIDKKYVFTYLKKFIMDLYTLTKMSIYDKRKLIRYKNLSMCLR